MINYFVYNQQAARRTELIFSGDLVLDAPGPDHWLSGIAPALQAADIAVGHLEVPHTDRGVELKADVPAPGANPRHLEALPKAGFDAVTLAGNHIADCGAEGIADTIAMLDRLHVRHTGAGQNSGIAREPAILEHAGRRIALLSYNCVGPEASWAGAERAGCAYVRIETGDGSPIAPSAQLQEINAGSLGLMVADIGNAKQRADVVIVALHKGIVHTPARLAPYERPLCYAAVDAGCDIVLGHHAHIVRGIEIYRGKPIFHGLGNGCVVTTALSPDQTHAARAEWARKRKKLFGFEPDPAYTLAPFHPEAVNAMLGRICLHEDGRMDVGFVPVHVEPPGRPVIADTAQARRIARYIERITLDGGLPRITLDFSDGGVWLR